MPASYAERLVGIVLPDANEKPVQLDLLWSQSPAVVVFLRHYGWIFCREHVAQLREHQSEFVKRGAKLAAVGLGDFNFARAFIEETGITFPLLVDDERKAYAALDLKHANVFHLLRGDNAKRRKEAKAAGHRQHGIKKNPFQLGGSFVFGPGNVDRFVHLSQTFSDNAPISALLAALP